MTLIMLQKLQNSLLLQDKVFKALAVNAGSQTIRLPLKAVI